MEEDKSLIVLLSDIHEQRKRRKAELEFYTEKKRELEIKLDFLRRDLALTETLIKLISKENSANTLNII